MRPIEKFEAALADFRRKVLADAAGRRVRRPDQERHRRHQEHRRPLGRRHHCGRVPACVRRRHAVDSPRHRRPGLDRRHEALHRQGTSGVAVRSHPGVGAELRVARASTATSRVSWPVIPTVAEEPALKIQNQHRPRVPHPSRPSWRGGRGSKKPTERLNSHQDAECDFGPFAPINP